MRSWVFRNRLLLESVYGRAGRPRPLTELVAPARGRPGGAKGSAAGLRVVLYDLAPQPRALGGRARSELG